MEKFCKLFETDAHGQILVKLDVNDKGVPEVRFYAQPEGLGVCSIAVSFSDDDAGWDLADKAFAKSDADFAVKQLEPIFKMADEQQ